MIYGINENDVPRMRDLLRSYDSGPEPFTRGSIASRRMEMLHITGIACGYWQCTIQQSDGVVIQDNPATSTVYLLSPDFVSIQVGDYVFAQRAGNAYDGTPVFIAPDKHCVPGDALTCVAYVSGVSCDSGSLSVSSGYLLFGECGFTTAFAKTLACCVDEDDDEIPLPPQLLVKIDTSDCYCADTTQYYLMTNFSATVYICGNELDLTLSAADDSTLQLDITGCDTQTYTTTDFSCSPFAATFTTSSGDLAGCVLTSGCFSGSGDASDCTITITINQDNVG